MPDASAEVVPNIHPDRRDVGYPASAVGQAGYHMADTACPISAETWDVGLLSALRRRSQPRGLVARRRAAAYALCRPPGHHAFADMAGGFCYVNNTAVAAAELRAPGTSAWRSSTSTCITATARKASSTPASDVLTVSLHADPVRFYPFFWGYADERGEGPGLGYNLNLPLPRHSGDEVFLDGARCGDRADRRLHARRPGRGARASTPSRATRSAACR